jgi:hypothetical protein
MKRMLWILLLILIPLVSAETFKHGEQFNFRDNCLIGEEGNRSGCSDSASCQIFIIDPHDHLLISNASMTHLTGTPLFNYTVLPNETATPGDYIFTMCCQDQGFSNCATQTLTGTGTGNEKPSGISIVIFYAVFLLAVGGFLFTFLRYMLQLPTLTVDLIDLVTTFGLYIAFFGFAVLQISFLNEPVLTDINNILIRVGAFTHAFVPFVFFIISYMKGNIQKVSGHIE